MEGEKESREKDKDTKRDIRNRDREKLGAQKEIQRERESRQLIMAIPRLISAKEACPMCGCPLDDLTSADAELFFKNEFGKAEMELKLDPA